MLPLLLAATILSGGTFDQPIRNGTSDAGYFQPYRFQVGTPVIVPRSTGSSVGSVEYLDTILNVSDADDTVVMDVLLSWSIRPSSPAFTVTRTDANNRVAPVSANPFLWSFVNTGTAQLILSNGVFSSTTPVVITATSSGTVTGFSGFVEGSVAENAALAIDALIAGKNPATAKAIFSTQNHATGVYVRNTACWAYSLDLTCLSPYNSYNAGIRAGTLIAPDVVLFATHLPIPPGYTLRFVTTGNAVVTRLLVSSRPISGTDLTIGKLDNDVPEGIAFAKILPSNWPTRLCIPREAGSYTPSHAWRCPILSLDQEEKALVGEIGYTPDFGRGWIYMQYPTTRKAFNESLITLDSGNPAFLIINGELVLMTIWTSGGAGAGNLVSTYASQINAAMTSLGSPYQLTTINLSSYATFDYE